MTEEEIIKSWRNGLTKLQVAEEYKKTYNKKQKQRKASEREKLINSGQALAYIEPILYRYQMKVLRG